MSRSAAARIFARLRAASARSRAAPSLTRGRSATVSIVPSRRGLDRCGDLADEIADQVGEAVAQLGIEQPALGIEGVVGQADGQLVLQDVRADRLEHLARLGLRPDRAEQPGARTDHGRGLAAQHVRRVRARGPVQRVLEHARDRGVVLGGGDQDGVGAPDRLAQRVHARGCDRAVDVLVVEGHVTQAVLQLERRAGRQRLRCRPEQAHVVGVGAKAARDSQELHAYACCCSSRWTFSVTFSPRMLPPLGSGMFQLMPYCVRSRSALSSSAMTCTPIGFSAGPFHVPVATSSLVMPLIVSSPRTVAVPSSARSTSFERNVTSGCLPASKNSSPRTWARNSGGLTIEIDSTFARPSRTPSAYVASTSESVPRKVLTPMCLTAKPNEEWMRSAWKRP